LKPEKIVFFMVFELKSFIALAYLASLKDTFPFTLGSLSGEGEWPFKPILKTFQTEQLRRSAYGPAK
jgi:hypothetical protein